MSSRDSIAATPPAVLPAIPAGTPSRSALITAFAAIYLIWGSTYLGIRVAVETMPPFAMAAARFLLAGALLFGFLRLRGAPAPTRAQWRANAVIGTFLLLGGNGLVAWAELSVPSGVTALIIGVQPLFFVLTEWAWPGGARPTLGVTAALLLGFAGVAWLAAPWESPQHGGVAVGGVIAILLACVFWAIGSIYARHSRHGLDPLYAASLQMLTGGVALALAAAAHGDFNHVDVAAISGRSWVAFVYLLGAGSLVGFSTFVWLIKHSTPARVSTYAYVNPLVAVFLGWLVLGEPVTSRTAIAAIVIVTAVVIITLQKNKPAGRG
ncbi:MAG TPA: EamA family transporter [Opitutus sp.]|nr:EamA family transporter [Opitutus sp.]